jgi:hypothetical protein
MKKLTVIFILLSTVALGQKVKIKEIKRDSTKWNNAAPYPVVIFPDIKAHSDEAGKKINALLIASFADTDSWNNDIEAAIDSSVNDNLYSLGYEVTYNNNNILSIRLNIICCNAYCSGWSAYYNFNITTGNPITMDDILSGDKKPAFVNKVLTEKNKYLTDYMSGMEDSLKKGAIDSGAYQWVSEIVNGGCLNNVTLDQFSISATGIEIDENCYLPHAIQIYQPDYDINYSYASISEFLNPEWKKILMK